MLQKVPGSEIPIHYIKLDEHLAPAVQASNGNIVNAPEFTIQADATDRRMYERTFKLVSEKLTELLEKTYDEALKVQKDGTEKIVVTYRYGRSIEESLELKKVGHNMEWVGRYSITAVPYFPKEPVIRITLD